MNALMDPYVNWFKSLPDDFQFEVVMFIATMLPNHPMRGTLSEPNVPVRFVSWVKDSSASTPEAVGLALALMAITNFVFVEERGSEEDWSVRWDRLDAVREAAASAGQLEESKRIESRMEHAADVSKSWIEAANNFRKICDSSLSYNSMRALLRRRN